MIELLGYFGSIILVFATLPQVIKCIKDGNSQGLSAGTLWLWALGMLLLLLYVILTVGSISLLLNYLANLIFMLVMLKYKYFPRNIIK